MPETVHAENAPAPVGAYPHARWAGDLLFLSGVGPRTPGTDAIPSGIEAQARAVFAHVEGVLHAAGASVENLVDVTVFLTNMQRDFETYNRVYAEVLGPAQPCRTTVEVGCLPTPIDIELKCIAHVPKREP